jgi:PAS domain-containing protein
MTKTAMGRIAVPEATPPLSRKTVKPKATRAAERDLTLAFTTFAQAAGSLEKSYEHLQTEVQRLHQELRRANAELEKSLEENARVRAYLSRVLESLPCGILVVSAKGQTQIINPEARRLLGVSGEWLPDSENPLPASLQKLFERVPASSFLTEQEWLAPDTPSNRSIGILRAAVSENAENPGDTVWIIRDITEQKRISTEREASRRSRALAEIAAVLAHEIRNPLGSMELFAGLLSDATTHMPETRQWVNHLQAGLRTLSSTQERRGQLHPAQLHRSSAILAVPRQALAHGIRLARRIQQRHKQHVGIAERAGIERLRKAHNFNTRRAPGYAFLWTRCDGRGSGGAAQISCAHVCPSFDCPFWSAAFESSRNSRRAPVAASFSSSAPHMSSAPNFQAPITQCPSCSDARVT